MSPFVFLELQYLNAIGKVTVEADAIVDELAAKLEMVPSDPLATKDRTIRQNLPLARWDG